MKATIDNMLTHVYELEGLLLVMKRRGNDIPQEVIDRYKEIALIVEQEAQLIETGKPEVKVAATPPITPPLKESKPKETVAAPPVTEATPPHPDEPPVFIPKEKTPEPIDITAAFSINDRFLFLRELFNGDKQKFDDTISQLQAMHNIDEIGDYLASELEWDMSDDIVKEFLRLVELGFKK